MLWFNRLTLVLSLSVISSVLPILVTTVGSVGASILSKG